MNTNRISVRYAKALFELSLESNKANKVNEDVKLFIETCNIPDFKLVLENPVIAPSKKMKVFKEIFNDKIDVLSMRFLELLTKNKRESYLKNISRNFLQIYRKHYGIKSMNLTTAFRINHKLQNQIIKIIGKKFNSKIELNKTVERNIIGGFVLTVEGNLYDASILGKLKKIESELLQIPVSSLSQK